jgi:hypothetical protein
VPSVAYLQWREAAEKVYGAGSDEVDAQGDDGDAEAKKKVERERARAKPSRKRVSLRCIAHTQKSFEKAKHHVKPENIRFTTPIQQSLTWRWVPCTGAYPHVRVVVQLLYWCCTRIKSPLNHTFLDEKWLKHSHYTTMTQHQGTMEWGPHMDGKC